MQQGRNLALPADEPSPSLRERCQGVRSNSRQLSALLPSATRRQRWHTSRRVGLREAAEGTRAAGVGGGGRWSPSLKRQGIS